MDCRLCDWQELWMLINMTKIYKNASNFKIQSTNTKLLDLKKIKVNIKFYISIQKIIHLVVQSKPKILILYFQNLKLNCEIIGISKDTMESHEKFR